MKEPQSCLRCGRCCFVDLTAYTQQKCFDRWRAENRQDMQDIINKGHLTWAGDRLVSTKTGEYTREYHPGSSELCPQWNIKKECKI
jgi:hypothetical protein